MGEDGSVGSEGVVDLCEDLLEGCGGPAEGVSDLIPLGDEVEDSPLEGSQVGEVGGPESLASENAEPLLTEPKMVHVLSLVLQHITIPARVLVACSRSLPPDTG